MAVHKTAVYGEGSHKALEISAEPDADQEVLFTDDHARFKIRVENVAGVDLDESTITLFFGMGAGTPEERFEEEIRFQVDSGESCVQEVDFGPTMYQGNGVLAVWCPPEGQKPIRKSSGGGKMVANPGKHADNYKPLFTTTVWDRDFYELHYQGPRKLLKWSGILSAGIIFVAFLQIVVTVALYVL